MSGVLDATCVTDLAHDVGAVAALGMLDRFLAMLPGRVERLHRAVAAGNRAELRDATLSLECSATMLGAHRLAALCGECRKHAEVPAELEQVVAITGSALASLRRRLSAER